MIHCDRNVVIRAGRGTLSYLSPPALPRASQQVTALINQLTGRCVGKSTINIARAELFHFSLFFAKTKAILIKFWWNYNCVPVERCFGHELRNSPEISSSETPPKDVLLMWATEQLFCGDVELRNSGVSFIDFVLVWFCSYIALLTFCKRGAQHVQEVNRF